jgi:Rho-binding antiterminator
MINESYTPIDCNMYDVLLSNATLKKECTIVFKNKDLIETIKAIIVDVYTKAKEEFLQLNTGVIIRLDKIISVDGIIINYPS